MCHPWLTKGLLSPCDTCACASLPCVQLCPQCSPRAPHLVVWPSREEREEGITLQPHGQDIVGCGINLGYHYVFVTFVLLSQLIPDGQEFSALMGPRGICKFKDKIGRTRKCMWGCNHGDLLHPSG